MIKFSSEEKSIQRELAALTLRAACPIVWHDRKKRSPKTVDGATCFFIRFENGIVGITAHHVLNAYKHAFASNSNVVCQLRTSSPFDFTSAVIDTDESRDLATFRISDRMLGEAETVALDCRGIWPPPRIDDQRWLSACGFPESMRRVTESGGLMSDAWGALPIVESFTDSEILITYDPSRDEAADWAQGRPPLGTNLSGCSGGPVLMHGELNGLQRWFPVGFVAAGPRNLGEGTSAEFDIIRVRRIHMMQPDGKIAKNDYAGWLPR